MTETRHMSTVRDMSIPWAHAREPQLGPYSRACCAGCAGGWAEPAYLAGYDATEIDSAGLDRSRHSHFFPAGIRPSVRLPRAGLIVRLRERVQVRIRIWQECLWQSAIYAQKR